MTNEKESYREEDMVINMRDMFYAIFRHWRSIIVGILVFTLLAGGYKYYKDYRQYRSEVSSADSAAEVIGNLDDVARTHVDNALIFHKRYAAQLTYNTTAPLMQLDAGAVAQTTVSYVLDGPDGYAAAVVYQRYLDDKALYTRIADKLGASYEPEYLSDLLSVSINNSGMLPGDGTAAIAGNVLLNVTVSSANEKDTETMTAVIKSYITEKETAIAATTDHFSCRLAYEGFSIRPDNGIANAQQNNMNQLKSLHDNKTNAEDALTAEERVAYNEVAKDEGDDEAVTKPSISKKYVVVGFGGGLIVMICFYMAWYLFGHKIRSAEEVKIRFGLPVFGTVGNTAARKARKGFDRFLYRRFYPHEVAAENQVALVESRIRLLAGQNDKKAFYVTGSQWSDADSERLSSLREKLQKDGVSVTFGACPLFDPASLEAMTQADAVILAEVTGKSVYSDVYRECELCRDHQLPVAGMILFD